MNTRTPRDTHAATGRTVKVTLDYATDRRCLGRTEDHQPYRITRIVNEIAVPVGKQSRHVGDYLTEAEATDLLTEPGVEVTTVPAKG